MCIRDRSYSPGTGNRLHAAFTQSSQNLHMLSNSSVGIPSDMWVPCLLYTSNMTDGEIARVIDQLFDLRPKAIEERLKPVSYTHLKR